MSAEYDFQRRIIETCFGADILSKIDAISKEEIPRLNAEKAAFWAGIAEIVPEFNLVLHDPEARRDLEAALGSWELGRSRRRWSRSEIAGNSKDVGIVNSVNDALVRLIAFKSDIQALVGTFDAQTDDTFRREIQSYSEKFLDILAPAIALIEQSESLLSAIPEQVGGRGLLSDQLRSSLFLEFAKVARKHWRKAGLCIGGNHGADEGFATFLSAVHMKIVKKPIPGKAELLASLRKTWPGPPSGKFR